MMEERESPQWDTIDGNNKLTVLIDILRVYLVFLIIQRLQDAREEAAVSRVAGVVRGHVCGLVEVAPAMRHSSARGVTAAVRYCFFLANPY